jgi:hypothetical protein
MEPPAESKRPEPPGALLTSTILLAFVATFLLARIMVLLIMTHRIPSLYLHLGKTHIHHLNYGIFLLSAVGGILLLRQPKGQELRLMAVVYGVGLALTFDEFGMWIHLGGPYWQRASFDAVVVIASLLGLLWAMPSLKKMTPMGWAALGALVLALAGFWIIWGDSLRFAAHRLSPVFQQIEAGSPP